MSTEHGTAIARPLIDQAREVRVIRAVYPQESLSQSTQSSNSEAVAAAPTIPCIYQNTGIQTLPPANGSVFRLIHGREPSHYDYARSMGSAGIGRLTNDPRVDPCDLIYGSAYFALAAVRKEKYTDSGFQTASHGTRIKALARAKVKASMMANRYRNAAFKAGYIIGAESQDEMIVHSEQFSSALQLDIEGNLLEGDVKTRSLPNICGALIHDEPSQAPTPREMSTAHTKHVAKEPTDVVHGVQTSQAPYPFPSDSSRMPFQESTAELQEMWKSVPVLAPASVWQSVSAFPVVDDEYGSWEPVTDEFVVFDAGAEHNTLVCGHDSRKTSRGKRKAGMSNTDNPLSKKQKSSVQVNSCNSPISLVPLPFISPSNIHQDCSSLLWTPDADVKPCPTLSGALTTQPEEFAQDRVMSLIEVEVPSKVISENGQSTSTDTSRRLESKYWRKTLRGQLDHNGSISTSAEANKPLKTSDASHATRAISNSELARLTGDTLEPIVAPAVAGTGRDGSGARATHRASQRSKPPSGETDPKSFHEDQVEKLAKNVVGEQDYREDNLGYKIGPTNKRTSSADGSAVAEISSHMTTPIVAIGNDLAASGRRKRTPVPRISHKIRQPMAPYVPPAKRLRDQNKLETEIQKRR